MKTLYPYCEKISLFVEGRISEDDALRQERTAREILKRLEDQPGLILADEVGMGKTFVALAVAASVASADRKRRPVVVMVPSTLKEKWPRDFEVFREKCLPPELRKKLTYARADRAIEFLKLLDDPHHRKRSMIFLTHGAMHRGLNDKWTKLALIHRALYRRKDIDGIRRALCRNMGMLLGMRWVAKESPDVWRELLESSPKHWLKVLNRHGIDPEGDDNPETDDDPVPEAVLKALKRLNRSKVDALFSALKGMPLRKSKHYKSYLKKVRSKINAEIKELWETCVKSLKLSLPLLILDEAHHLKNPYTRLSSLFHDREAEDEAYEVSRGKLEGAFERMLFLTATPFQLGHYELCSVLERFQGVRWKGRNAAACGKGSFLKEVDRLRSMLDEAQEAAVRLDRAWGGLRHEDLVVDGTKYDDVEGWWRAVNRSDGLGDTARLVLDRYRCARDKMRAAEGLLRP